MCLSFLYWSYNDITKVSLRAKRGSLHLFDLKFASKSIGGFIFGVYSRLVLTALPDFYIDIIFGLILLLIIIEVYNIIL